MAESLQKKLCKVCKLDFTYRSYVEQMLHKRLLARKV